MIVVENKKLFFWYFNRPGQIYFSLITQHIIVYSILLRFKQETITSKKKKSLTIMKTFKTPIKKNEIIYKLQQNTKCRQEISI